MNSGLLAGKRGVVLGVANEKSIAWACARACVDAGASLIFSYQGEVLEKRVGKLIETLPRPAPMFPCDVGLDDEIEAFFLRVEEQWDSLDFVIHSLAFAEKDDLKNPFFQTPRANFAKALDISAYSLVAVTRRAAPLFKHGGSIVAMTYYGAEKVVPHYNVMGVAKAALEMSARYLAVDLGPQNIRVNCVSAGPIRTLSASAIPGMRQLLDVNQRVTPLRRNTDAEEVARSTVYLLSDLASGVTGEVLHVDCGFHVLGLFAAEEEKELAE
ncbi:MAG: enoyl-ACP reductase [Candidatus Hydrogenedentes bacterium]|nr:enoyl-ACP reductase [Candidatus Hydrogenedentota bacterium]MBI3119716.1 enoyl-ACP reductase [Candidatus Hydrogenedentota bacterium]